MEIALKYRCYRGTLLFLALFLLDANLYSQRQSETDTIYPKIPPDYFRIWENRSGAAEWPAGIPRKPRPPSLSDNERYPLFFDSLKIKASKHLITKKLYDFVIVSDKPSSISQISGSSEEYYQKYSGMIIRHIEIRRLNVFGTDINNPLLQKTGSLENLLNKTHANTIEKIIRKNLLFTEGDTISPLLISDNERILRQLPYIDDSRIFIYSESDNYVDVIVLTKDVYSLGGSYEFKAATKGSLSLFEKNIFGIGHELRLRIPYDSDSTGSPGIGINYNINNISKSFINLNLFYYDAFGKKMYGFGIDRKLISTSTKYAGGIFINQTFTTEDLDTLPEPEPLKYNYQDYWLSRSFLLNGEKASRLIFGVRYLNNNVFRHPYILPDSYHELQRFKMFLASVSLSFQKFYKSNLIYGYGRTEDIPHGSLIKITAGKELNEFKKRYYAGLNISAGDKVKSSGYLYGTAGIATFFNEGHAEQGILNLTADYFTSLRYIGTHRIRNFYKSDYTRGFGRYLDEYLLFSTDNGFSGFRNDSLRAERQRLTMSFESVLFSPRKIYGFRFAYFAFGDLGYLFGSNEFFHQGEIISRIGVGLRLRNDNLVFKTLQIRLSYYPHLPKYSGIRYFNISGEQPLNPGNFDPGPPSLMPYR